MKRIWYGCPACGYQGEHYPNQQYCPECKRRLTRIGAVAPERGMIVIIAAQLAEALQGMVIWNRGLCPDSLLERSQDALLSYHKAVGS